MLPCGDTPKGWGNVGRNMFRALRNVSVFKGEQSKNSKSTS
jgi:hypothetical protein